MKTLLSGNMGDDKNLHTGGLKFIFLINFLETFSFLFSLFCFFYSCLLLLLLLLFVCCFLKLKMDSLMYTVTKCQNIITLIA